MQVMAVGARVLAPVPGTVHGLKAVSRRSVFEHTPELLEHAAHGDAMRACVVRKAPQRSTE